MSEPPLQFDCQSFTSTKLGADDFRFINTLVRERFGINLSEQKRPLVIGRLQKMLQLRGFADFHAYRLHLESNAGAAELSDLANQLSTNYTYFFREPQHFTFLREVALPEIKVQHQSDRTVRIWCAAAASGEEPYSIVMTMREFFAAEYGQWDAGLLATDISAKALTAAAAAVYSDEQVRNIPGALQQKYFRRSQDGSWQVTESLRREVTLRRFNLMNETFPFKKPFDLIFCRNVMIYFDSQTRERLVQRFVQFLLPGGYLVIGHSESLGRAQPQLQYVRPAVYRRVN